MKIPLSISPCPNDTFMFDALLNGRVDTEGLDFTPRFEDIEALNSTLVSESTGTEKPLVSKASYAVLPIIRSRYAALNSGSALGRGNGPLFVAADDEVTPLDYDIRIAIPGEHTTANLLMERLHPRLTNKKSYLFSDIPKVIRHGECDAGVLIHEGRFVYKKYGLKLISDLGTEWEKRKNLPLPLGAIVVDRTLSPEIQEKIDRVLQRSIRYAFDNPDASTPLVRRHAQEMDEQVMRDHINLFVNEHSLDIGPTGIKAVEELLGIRPEELFRQ